MRHMSFSHTVWQMENDLKTVTRRRGWDFLQPGDLVMACVKCMGLQRGETVEKLYPIRILSVRKEPLNEITQEDVAKEGFPLMSPKKFIDFFCKAMGGEPDQPLNRIEFERAG